MSKTPAADREDFLEEDAPVPGQKFCLLSFLSPEKVLANKSVFMFDKFLQGYEFNSRTKNLEAFLVKFANGVNSKLDKEADDLLAKDLSGASDICRASKLNVSSIMDDYQAFVKSAQRELRESKLKEAFDDYLYANKTTLEDEFYRKNEFRTTVRGLKVRGVYASQEEAVARSKRLQRLDPLHNIFVGEIGKWLPWDPEPSDVAEQEYAEDQLNTLMKKYKENEQQREEYEREKRTRSVAGSKKASEPGVVISRVEDGEAGGSSNVAAAGGGDAAGAPAGQALGVEGPNAGSSEVATNFAGMFGSSGPADLAIARKMGF
jgi:hypothetical protein